MVQLGKINRLTVLEVTPQGCYLDAGTIDKGPGAIWGAGKVKKLLLPARELSPSVQAGDALDVFVYPVSDDDWVATTATPHVRVGECGFLKVVSVNDHGAFLDWGLPKDLLLPFSEQAYPVRVGNCYVVYVFLDQSSQRLACSTNLHQHLPETSQAYKPRESVELLIAGKSELGFKAVINGECLGLVFHEDLGQPLRFGDRMRGWIKTIRADGKIDLSVNSLDRDAREAVDEVILAYLKKSGGRANLTDKSSPEDIFGLFKVSKKNFKRSLSRLYKARLISIQADYIELV